jgi:predicted ABC-type ATPase
LLTQRAEPVRFLNADEIARGLSPFAPELAAIRAGRLLLGELRACLEARQSFALESTLSGRGYVRMLAEARAAGFEIHLNYLWLRGAGMSVRRVRQRVRKGGHHVPEEDIRRRYARSIEHVVGEYLPLADRWWIWDNEQNPPQLLASSTTHGIETVASLLS